MSLIGVMNIYNEVENIEWSLQSLWVAGCHRIIIVDGAYELFPTKSSRSDDGTLKIIKKTIRSGQYGDIILVQAKRRQKWASQIDKRNAYLAYAHPGDWVLILDGDEALAVGNPSLFHTCLKIYAERKQKPCLVTLTHYKQDRERWSGALPRLLLYDEDVHYHIKHGILHDRYCRKIPSVDTIPQSACYLIHVKRKNPERRGQQLEYKRLMRERSYIEPVDAPR